MAEKTVNYDSELGTKVEEAFGGTIQDHLQAAVDRFMERCGVEALAIVRHKRLDEYERLPHIEQQKIDAILSTAPKKSKEDSND